MKENSNFAYYEDNENFELGFSNSSFDFEQFFKDKKYSILKQIHSDIVLKIKTPVKFKEGDGIISDAEDIYLIVKTADCYPVLAYNLRAGFIAALHSGWRGVYKNIFESFKEKANEFGEEKIIENYTKFIIGPGICERCYRVGDEFYENFKKIGFHSELFDFVGDSIYFNIRKGIEKRLKNLKFKKENITNINICTYENDTLFSYRRDKTDSRLFNFIRLKRRS